MPEVKKNIDTQNIAQQLLNSIGRPPTSKDVLIIDDDKWIHRIVSSLLKGWGFNPISAYDPVEGLAAAIQSQPLIIILDILMPMMNGDVLLKVLKKLDNTSQIPTIIMSGAISREIFGVALRDGASAFISKPITQEKLLEKIKESLGLAVTYDPSIGKAFFTAGEN
ncbi:MAG: response regulator [Ignavibacteriae bacterium]|nr:response regulator [Ignavibacteriota bacterium]